MDIKTRLKEFIKSENLTVSAFEKSIGASNGYVNSISKGIGSEKLDLILEKYPNLNLQWLLTGVYPNFKKSKLTKSKNETLAKHSIQGIELTIAQLSELIVKNQEQLRNDQLYTLFIENIEKDAIIRWLSNSTSDEFINAVRELDKN